MKNSNEFMLLFRYQPDFNYQPSAEDLAQMQQQWGAYIGGLAIQEKLVSTYQLGFEGAQIATDQTETEGILIAENQTLSGNMIIKAVDLKDAIQVAKGCPILLMGGNVEVRSIIPM